MIRSNSGAAVARRMVIWWIETLVLYPPILQENSTRDTLIPRSAILWCLVVMKVNFRVDGGFKYWNRD